MQFIYVLDYVPVAIKPRHGRLVREGRRKNEALRVSCLFRFVPLVMASSRKPANPFEELLGLFFKSLFQGLTVVREGHGGKLVIGGLGLDYWNL